MQRAIRKVLHELDPALAFSNVATTAELVERSLQRPRSLSLLVGCFAFVALALSLIGIYGVMSHYVQQHAKDISIRLALGGSPGNVLGLVIGQGMKVVASGVAIGVLAALVATRLLSTLLFGVTATDAVTFLGASTFLVAIALIACLVPARRATGLEPAAVLREE
jgi:putative ABC transport system permease protein